MYSAARAAAMALQRALLPQSVAVVEGWDIAAHYSPAGAQDVGGDWYDVISLRDGRIAAVVGDVMGRGIEAAAAMGQMRSTLRAFMAVDPQPHVALSRMDDLFETLDLSQMVTMLYLLTSADGPAVAVGNAGHLPPLLCRPGEPAQLIDVGVGLPLGAGGDVRTPRSFDLPDGAALVVVTDGAVERRGEDIDEGIARLLEHASLRPGEGLQDLVDRIVASAAADQQHDDDVTVLALRRLSPG
jgi:serine phosphatase RsbU (regulator of sigma subunit)